MNNTLMKIVLLTACIALFIFPAISQEKQTQRPGMDAMWGESSVTADALKAGRGKLFDEGNYSMFIHWGLYSHLGGKWKGKTYYGIGEWIMNGNMAGIPVDEYKEIAKEFNPVDFDARAIARLAKDAGMKYIIITSKHHDGFAMFHSKADPFNIVDATPFGRDPMKELAEACRAEGLGFGFYYSHNQDWTAPGGSGGPKSHPDGTPASFEDYFYKKCVPQVKEICSNYGPIDFVWFDTPGNMKKELVVELVRIVRELQPHAMINSRVGHEMGDYASKGDMEVPPRNIEGLWETCDTNNDSWSYAWYDRNFKNPKEILHRLISTVARGGTYLLNVGPDGRGIVPETGAGFLREAGTWIERYPQVVYAAGSSPWERALPWGDITTSGSSLFLSVFEWPKDGRLWLPGLKTRITGARLLNTAGNNAVQFTKGPGDWTVFTLPCQPSDKPVSVVEVMLDGPAAQAAVGSDYGIYPNIAVQLLAEFGKVTGAERKKVSWMEKFGEWKHVDQISKWEENGEVKWSIDVPEAGYYYAGLHYKGEERLVWRISTGEGELLQNQQGATGKYSTYPMGIIGFKKPGKHVVSVSLVSGNRETSSLESLVITPVDSR
jgi:alpha-L-fucosidase